MMCFVHDCAKVQRDNGKVVWWECPRCQSVVDAIECDRAATDAPAERRYPIPATAEQRAEFAVEIEQRAAMPHKPWDGFDWLGDGQLEPIEDAELRAQFVEQLLQTRDCFARTIALRYELTVQRLESLLAAREDRHE